MTGAIVGWLQHPMQFPGDDADIVNTRRRLYLKPLEFPSAVLLYTSGFTVLAFISHVLLWHWATYKGDEMLAREFDTWLAQWHIWTPVVLLNSFISFAAIQMYRGRRYWICIAGSILATLPTSPFFIFTIPFGIWSIVLLTRSDMQQAFQEFKSIK